MVKLWLGDLTQDSLRSVLRLHERGIVLSHWEGMNAPITPREQLHLDLIRDYLVDYQVLLMNEATIWSRAIYPLLLLAERRPIQAWAQIRLRATFSQFQLDGIVDGVLGHALSGSIAAPYLVVVEAKRGLEAQNPQYQLLGSMLTAAWINQREGLTTWQEIYGCYTVADTWTFVHGIVSDMDADRPSMVVQYSREYSERMEAEVILRILKTIVGRKADAADEPRQAA